MPVALLGLPALGALLATVVTKFFEWILTKGAARLAIIIALSTALYAAIDLLIVEAGNYIGSVLITNPQISSFGYLLPSNTSDCIAAIVGVELICVSYSLFNRVFRIKLESTQ